MNVQDTFRTLPTEYFLGSFLSPSNVNLQCLIVDLTGGSLPNRVGVTKSERTLFLKTWTSTAIPLQPETVRQGGKLVFKKEDPVDLG